MYKNVGKKIMKLAQVGSIAGNVLALILAIDALTWDEYGLALIYVGVGVFCMLSSWPLYGFGQLVDDVHAMRNQSAEPAAQNDELPEL